MSLLDIILITLGLSLFEIISSIDNAIINAEVLNTMSAKARRWFLFWGILFAVFIVRGILPWLIVWATVPSLGPVESFTAALSSDPLVVDAIQKAAPPLLAGGGIFLIFLFLHWLFIEPKNFGLKGEKFFLEQAAWFFAIVSVLLMLIVWQALKIDSMLAFGAVVGSTAFFITHGFKQNAEEREKKLLNAKNKGVSDWSKIFYLEAIDTTFSIDGVLGAFAFTLAVPLILIGNGIGAIVVRQLTVGNIERVKKYVYLKNGAMYSVLSLGIIMLLESFSWHIPTFAAPVITFIVIGYFLFLSIKRLKYE